MSSPARHLRFNSYTIRSSSPELPSLGEILRNGPRKLPPLRSGSNAAPVPATARSTFTSAADILREAPEIDIDTEQITNSPPRKAKPARKPRAKPQQAKVAPGVANGAIEIELSPKRFKAKSKKSTSENNPDVGQTSLPKGRVTKVTAADKGKGKAEKKTNSLSRCSTTADEKGQDERQIAEPQSDLPSQPQELALARRTDWTPPRANTALIILDSESDNRELLSSAEKAVGPKEVFGKLFDEFAHKDENAGLDVGSRVSPETSEIVSNVLKKRKRLEPAASNNDKNGKKPAQSGGHSPIKLPVAKKKARTLTELATAPYVTPEIPDVDLLAPGNKESLLRYFDTDGNFTALVEHQSIVMDKNNENPKKKPAKSRKSKKGDSAEQPILLSPSSALKQSTAQDFLFGTSSQLVLEDSPRTLRDLQAAIKASIQQDNPFASSPVHKPKSPNGLWHAGARDAEGEMLEADTISLMDTEEESVDVREPCYGNNLDQTEFLDIGDICSSSPPTANRSSNANLNISQTQEQILKSAAGNTCGAAAAQSSTKQSLSSKETLPATTAQPNYELFTDTQLAKQIKSYGFKPIKRRQAMIALLDQCWASQHPGSSIAHSSLVPTASISTYAAQTSPRKTTTVENAVELAKKPRGRPKKVDQNVDDTATSPNRGRGRPKKADQSTVDDDVIVSPKRGRGRPRKDDGAVMIEHAVASPPRGRGRPKKAEGSPAANTAVSPPRGRGRPRKVEGSPAASNTAVSPPRGRGRPRKISATPSESSAVHLASNRTPSPPGRKRSAQKAIEIADSENDDSLSLSPGSLADAVFSSPPPLDLSMSEEGETSLNLTPTEQDANLFTHITKAVTSAPRSTDPNDPSWHEKMLLYDPVVLEELASWLNSGELTRVGYDGEVSPNEVKNWCESKSVICLWKANTRGKERKRY